VATSENPSWTASGFGDGNQTRLSNLNQDKDVMLGKGNVTFMEIWKSAGSWKYYFHGVMEVASILEYFLIGLWKGANALIRLG